MDDVRNIRQLPVYRQRRYRILPIVLVTLVVLGFIAAAVLKFWVDYLWFTELHQGGVFTTRLQWSLIVGLAVGLITFLALFCSLAVVRRIARDDFYAPFLNSPRRSTLRGAESDLPDARDQPVLSARALKPIALGVAVLGGLLGGLTAGSQWVTVLAFIGRSSFHMTDPLFHHDLSFYVFTVPFLEMISATISSIIVTTAVVTALAYLATGVIRYTPATRISKPAALHLALFGSLLLALQALTFRIYAWNLVHSAHGIAVGAGFTDRNARLPGSFIHAHRLARRRGLRVRVRATKPMAPRHDRAGQLGRAGYHRDGHRARARAVGARDPQRAHARAPSALGQYSPDAIRLRTDQRRRPLVRRRGIADPERLCRECRDDLEHSYLEPQRAQADARPAAGVPLVLRLRRRRCRPLPVWH